MLTQFGDVWSTNGNKVDLRFEPPRINFLAPHISGANGQILT